MQPRGDEMFEEYAGGSRSHGNLAFTKGFFHRQI